MKEKKLFNLTSVNINKCGGLEIFDKNKLVLTISGRYWKTAIANGQTVFALGLAGTVIEIDKHLQIKTYKRKIKNSIDLLWLNNSLMVLKEDGDADVFVDGEYKKTLTQKQPASSPTPTPSLSITQTPSPSLTNYITSHKIEENNYPIKQIKQNIETEQPEFTKQFTTFTPTPTQTPSPTPTPTLSETANKTDEVVEHEEKNIFSKILNWFA